MSRFDRKSKEAYDNVIKPVGNGLYGLICLFVLGWLFYQYIIHIVPALEYLGYLMDNTGGAFPLLFLCLAVGLVIAPIWVPLVLLWYFAD